MKCDKCSKDFEEKEIHEHHIHPKFMNNKSGDGSKLYLCKKCHDKIHFIIPSIYWDLLMNDQKEIAIYKVIKFTKKYGGANDSNSA